MNVFVVGVASSWSLALSLAGMSVAPVEVPDPQVRDEAPAREQPETTGPTDEASSDSQDPEPVDPVDPEPKADVDEAPSMEDALFVEAKDRYVEGRQLFEAKRYLEAAAAFERSYAAVPGGPTLYATALSFEKGGDTVRAIDAYLRYLDLPECPAPQALCAEKRDEVSATVRKLKALVGVLAIKVDPGVKVRGIEVEERMIPVEDFPLVLEPGRYELRVRGLERGQERMRTVDIEAGQRTSLLVTDFDKEEPVITPPVRDGPTQQPRVTPEERRRRLRIAFYSGVGLTAAGVVGFSVTGGLAQQAFNEQAQRCKGEGMSCAGTDYPRAARDRVETLRPVTNALIGVTAGVGIVTTVVGLFAFSKRDNPSSSASVTRVRATPGGFRVRF